MLKLREYQNHPKHLSDYLPWACLVGEGVVLNKELMRILMCDLEVLNSPETLTYLHNIISDKDHTIRVPDIPAYMDAFLCDTPLLGGLYPKLGQQHLRCITILGFPNATYPSVFDALNDLNFPYRWVTRWIPLDKQDAQKHLKKIRRHWFAKRKSIAALTKDIVFQEGHSFEDRDALNKARDAETALEELGSDDVAYGLSL